MFLRHPHLHSYDKQKHLLLTEMKEFLEQA